MSVTFKFLGTGAGPGVPSYFCDCAACREAKNHPKFARTRSGAVIDNGEESILIDASPDLRSQFVRENLAKIDHVLITHWHYDHFGGLGDLEFYVKLSRKSPIHLYLPPSAVESFQAAYPFLHDVFNVTTWQFEKSLQFKNVKITPLPAVHSIQTAGIFIESTRSVAYFTDTAGLPDVSKQRTKQCDYLVCDATFYGENWYPHSHMSVDEAINLGEELDVSRTILTHLAMHYSTPISSVCLEEQLKQYERVTLAYDGMVLTL